MNQLCLGEKGNAKNLRLVFSLLCFTILGTPTWGMEHPEEENKPHAFSSIISSIKTVPSKAIEIPENYLKWGIGVSKVLKELYQLSQKDLDTMTKCPGVSSDRWVEDAAPLETEEDEALMKKLRIHVEILSGEMADPVSKEMIGPRSFNLNPGNLEKAANYIEYVAKKTTGLHVEKQTNEQSFKEIKNTLVNKYGFKFNKHENPPCFVYKEKKFPLRNRRDSYAFTNIIVEKTGTNPDKFPILTFVAHYDTVNDSPGAADNGSGVAALLVLMEKIAEKDLGFTVRSVFVPNEEWPLSRVEKEDKTPLMGSLYYFRGLGKEEKDKLDVVALDSVGYYSTKEKSQDFRVSILGKQYRDTKANFIALIGKGLAKDRDKHNLNLEPQPLLVRFGQGFAQHGKIRSEYFNVPRDTLGFDNHEVEPTVKNLWNMDKKKVFNLIFKETGHSDHHSAEVEKITSAILMTDTAMARSGFYHTSHDTSDTLDYTHFTRFVETLINVVSDDFYKDDSEKEKVEELEEEKEQA